MLNAMHPASPYFNKRYELQQARLRKDLRLTRQKYAGYYMRTKFGMFLLKEQQIKARSA